MGTMTVLATLAFIPMLVSFEDLECGNSRTCTPASGTKANGSGNSGGEALDDALFTSCGEACGPCEGTGCEPSVDDFQPGSGTKTKWGGTPGGLRTVEVTFGSGVSITVSCSACTP